MILFKLCMEHCDHTNSTRYFKNMFFSDLQSLFDYAIQFEGDQNWELRIFPVDSKIKYPWSKEYDDR